MDYEIEERRYQSDPEPFEVKAHRLLKLIAKELCDLSDRVYKLESDPSVDISQLKTDLENSIAMLQSDVHTNTARLDGCEWCGQGNLGVGNGVS